jgi:hypothetical protein
MEEQRQGAETAARERALADMDSRIEGALSTPEAAAQEAPTDEVDDENVPAARGTVFAHQAAETAEHEQTVETSDHQRGADAAGNPTANGSKDPELDEFDIEKEVAQLLKNRRWEERKEPFKGFDSPPGRF